MNGRKWDNLFEQNPNRKMLNFRSLLYSLHSGSVFYVVIRTGTIAMYDYGNENDNMDHYGQPTPPVYNMTSIPNDLPLFIGYGGKDYLTDVRDVQVLLDNLKDHDGDKLVVQYTDEYAHADFVLGVNANQIVYDPVIAFFKIN